MRANSATPKVRELRFVCSVMTRSSSTGSLHLVDSLQPSQSLAMRCGCPRVETIVVNDAGMDVADVVESLRARGDIVYVQLAQPGERSAARF